jgi:hypothetical protein
MTTFYLFRYVPDLVSDHNLAMAEEIKKVIMTIISIIVIVILIALFISF